MLVLLFKEFIKLHIIVVKVNLLLATVNGPLFSYNF